MRMGFCVSRRTPLKWRFGMKTTFRGYSLGSILAVLALFAMLSAILFPTFVGHYNM